MSNNIETRLFGNRSRLKDLRVAHRDLDIAITELNSQPQTDQLRVKRLKKQKLMLKDLIVRMESELIPDLNA